MTELLRSLVDWACSVLQFLASCIRKYTKFRQHRARQNHYHHHMAAAAAPPTTTSSPCASGPWHRRTSADQFPGEPAPAAKRFKDAEAAAPPVPTPDSRGLQLGNGSLRIQTESMRLETGPAVSAAASNSTQVPAQEDHVQPLTPAAASGSTSTQLAAPALLLRRRPAMIVIPDQSAASAARREFEREAAARKFRDEHEAATATSCFVVGGEGYCVATRNGSRREATEDGHDAIIRVDGDAGYAYFGVFDGHGGRAAVDFVVRNLGRNVLAALRQGEEPPADAIRRAYAATDRDFVSQNLPGGACVATVVLKHGVLHAANAGDCRVVLSRGGVASALTRDHRAGREDERLRIESTGGFVSCYGGGAVWRVQDSLSVTRSIGDAQLKQWVIPDPEVTEFRLLQDGCNGDEDFLILASDGLWDHLTDQEAVDVVLANGGCGDLAARALADAPFARGGRDDVTVMLVHLRGFVHQE